jgi:hypothetical protein
VTFIVAQVWDIFGKPAENKTGWVSRYPTLAAIELRQGWGTRILTLAGIFIVVQGGDIFGKSAENKTDWGFGAHRLERVDFCRFVRLVGRDGGGGGGARTAQHGQDQSLKLLRLNTSLGEKVGWSEGKLASLRRRQVAARIDYQR